MIAHIFLFFVPCLSTNPEHVVVDETDASKRLGKHGFLPIRWIESKLIGTFYVHLNIIRILFKRFKNNSTPYIPIAEARGITALFDK